MSNQKLSKKLDGVTLTHLIIMGVAIVSLLVLLVVNTLQMSRAIRDNVAMRLSDIAEQTDDNVSRALILYEDTLKRAARSFSLAKEEVTLNDFLERQTESLIFDAMFIVDAQGEVILCLNATLAKSTLGSRRRASCPTNSTSPATTSAAWRAPSR